MPVSIPLSIPCWPEDYPCEHLAMLLLYLSIHSGYWKIGKRWEQFRSLLLSLLPLWLRQAHFWVSWISFIITCPHLNNTFKVSWPASANKTLFVALVHVHRRFLEHSVISKEERDFPTWSDEIHMEIPSTSILLTSLSLLSLRPFLTAPFLLHRPISSVDRPCHILGRPTTTFRCFVFQKWRICHSFSLFYLQPLPLPSTYL